MTKEEETLITQVRVLSADNTEALFCLALLNTLDLEQTNRVLKRYLQIRAEPEPILTALGRNL